MRWEEEGGRGKTKERDIATNLEATAWRKHVLLLFKVAFLLFFLFFVCGRVIECLCEFLLSVVLVLEVVCGFCLAWFYCLGGGFCCLA